MTMDGSQVLWSKNADKPRAVASTIKMLNALVVMDNANLDDVVTVPKQAASISDGAVGLRTGQKYTVRQLLTVMLVHSANDAAEALAIHVGGSEKNFVAMMNAKAASLGLRHTRARDPHGLGKHERSTANDLAVIARTLMANPELRAIVRRQSASLPAGKGKAAKWGTTDALLGSYPGMEGVKTGYTDPAGYVFVGAAKRNGVELLGVVMGASSSAARFTNMHALLDWGFANYKAAPPHAIVSLEGTMGVVLVVEGREPTVTVHASAVTTAMDVEGSDITTRLVLPQSVKAPVACGQQLGALEICRAGSTVASIPLVADNSVAAPPKPDPTALALARRTEQPSLWERVSAAWNNALRALLSGMARTAAATQ